MVFIFSGGIRKLSDLNTVIKNNTKVYLIRWHQVARTSSIEQGLAQQIIMPTMPQGCLVPTGSVAPDGSSVSQEQETAPQDAMKSTKKMEVAMKTETGRTCEPAAWWWGKRTCETATFGLLADPCEETQEQALVIWAWNIKEQAVVRSRLAKEEMLSRQKQRRY